MGSCRDQWSIGIWVGRGSSGAECRFDPGSGGKMKKQRFVVSRGSEIFLRDTGAKCAVDEYLYEPSITRTYCL